MTTDAGTLNFAGLFASYEGFIDIVVVANNGVGSGDATNTATLILPNTNDGVLYGILETRAGFTPTSASTYRVKIYTEYAN